jgi:aryl-alcohol dehydrogenase-like predicted oxidoreductase
MTDTPVVESRIGLGLAAIARPAYITSGRDQDLGEGRSVEQLRARSETLLDTAYTGGIRYLDVARSYGMAEDFLAGWLHARPDVDDVVIGSKWGYRYVGDWQPDAPVHEVKDHSKKAFAEQIRLTRQHLGDRLAIYHVHSMTPDSPALIDQELHEALADLRDQHVRIGFSTSGPAQADVIRRGMDIVVNGAPLFTSIESTWNLMEPSAGPALAEAAQARITVIVKEVVANGRLTPGRSDPQPAAVAARELAQRLNVGVDQVAIAAALAQPWAWRVLSGAVTVRQLQENLAGEHLRLAPGDIDDLTQRALAPHEYWAERSRRAWT